MLKLRSSNKITKYHATAHTLQLHEQALGKSTSASGFKTEDGPASQKSLRWTAEPRSSKLQNEIDQGIMRDESDGGSTQEPSENDYVSYIQPPPGLHPVSLKSTLKMHGTPWYVDLSPSQFSECMSGALSDKKPCYLRCHGLGLVGAME